MENTFEIVAQALTALGLTATCVSLLMKEHFAKWTKTIDITDTFLRRYDELMKERDLVFGKKQSKEMYWRRYWHLQQEEYVMWKKGIVDKKFYNMWLDYRQKEWEGDDEEQREEYRNGWEDVKDFLETDFREFMGSRFQEKAQEHQVKERGYASWAPLSGQQPLWPVYGPGGIVIVADMGYN